MSIRADSTLGKVIAGLSRGDHPDLIRMDTRRALADEVEDAAGDMERLPPDVADRLTDLLHRWRTGRDT